MPGPAIAPTSSSNNSQQKQAKELLKNEQQNGIPHEGVTAEQQKNAITVAFEAFEGVALVSHEIVQTQSVILNANAQSQFTLNNEESALRLNQLPSNVPNLAADDKENAAAQAEITKIQIENQQVQDDRDYYNNMMIVERQQAEVSQTNLNQGIDNDEQVLQIASSLLKLAVKLSGAINR